MARRKAALSLSRDLEPRGRSQGNLPSNRKRRLGEMGMVLLLLVLAGLPSLAQWLGIDRSGTDDRAMEMIGQISPGYQPWAEPIFEPSERLEPLLFLLQAFGGAGVLLYLLRRHSRGQLAASGKWAEPGEAQRASLAAKRSRE